MKLTGIYFRLCLGVFILASCVGINFALSYLVFVHDKGWAAWRPGIGIAILFTSTVLSFVGFCLCVQRARQPSARGA